MPQQIRAVVVDPSVPGRLAIQEVSLREPDHDEVGVKVTAISLNRERLMQVLVLVRLGEMQIDADPHEQPLARSIIP